MTVVHEAEITVSLFSRLSEPQRDDVVALLDAHGGGDHVTALRYDVVDAPLLRLTVHKLDERGRAYCEPGEVMAATEQREVLLRSALPEWWQPAWASAGSGSTP